MITLGEKPDAILTGSSDIDSAETLGIKIGRENGIKTVSVIDLWKEYENCFSLEGEMIFPDFVCAIDEQMQKDIITFGIEPRRIIITESPYFDEVAEQFTPEFDKGRILFASQPIKQAFGTSRGYNQYDSFEMMNAALKGVNTKHNVCVRIHPREKDSLEFKGFEMDTSKDSMIAVLNSEIVVSMFSTVLVEAGILGRKAIGIIPEKEDTTGQSFKFSIKIIKR